jgi:putative DNA methylase
MFASYKGEGTGAIRHMFAHHILKPERVPIEGNVWGTSKSSGSFSTLFKSRLMRAIEYHAAPFELEIERTNGSNKGKRVFGGSAPFSGRVETKWPPAPKPESRAIHLSCGSSASTGLPNASVDLVVTDPPFFDNVHYSELADFFFAWQQLGPGSLLKTGTVPFGQVVSPRQTDTADKECPLFQQAAQLQPGRSATTRSRAEVQDSDAARFSQKLRGVLAECHRVLKDEGLLVFTYHHSRDEGWTSLAESILGAGFAVVNSQPVKAEMSVATPKFLAREPIQLDIILVCRKIVACRKNSSLSLRKHGSTAQAIVAANAKLARLEAAGFSLSRNDRKIVLYGQLLTTIGHPTETTAFATLVEAELDSVRPEAPAKRGNSQQKLLFREA